MVAWYEAEKQLVSDQKINTAVKSQLQIGYQRKVNEMEEQLHQRDAEILISAGRSRVSIRCLNETTNQLLSKGAALF